jgi:hypothetical protein
MMNGLTTDQVRGLAARHHASGVDGIYVFNWFGSALTYGPAHDLPRQLLDDIASAERLRYRDKTFALSRSHEGFPNCLPIERQIPCRITSDTTTLIFDVADDPAAAGQILRSCRLLFHINNMSVADGLEVRLNGVELPLVNPIPSGERWGTAGQWQIYDLVAQLPRVGANTVTVKATRINDRAADELPLTIEDAEIEIRYEWPTGAVAHGPNRRAHLPHLALPGR